MKIHPRSMFVTGGCVALVAGAVVGTSLAAAAADAGSVRGAVVSTADGAPVRGASAYAVLRHRSGLIDVRSTASRDDGTFAFADLAPGRYAIAVDKRGWQGTLGAPARVRVAPSGKTSLTHPLTLTPVGYAQLTYRSRAGNPIEARYVSIAVDGCPAAPALGPGRLCGVRGINDRLSERGNAWREYVLAPGTHRVRALVTSPLDGTVRRVTRAFVVHGGDAYTTVARTLRFRADPVTRARIVRVSGAAVTVRLPSYTDGSSPRLRTTLESRGAPVAGTTVRYLRRADGTTIARVTVPVGTEAGSVRAILHGTRAHAGAVTDPVPLR